MQFFYAHCNLFKYSLFFHVLIHFHCSKLFTIHLFFIYLKISALICNYSLNVKIILGDCKITVLVSCNNPGMAQLQAPLSPASTTTSKMAPFYGSQYSVNEESEVDVG